MKESTTKKLLKERKLRITSVRNEILSIFNDRNYALSFYDLEKELKTKFDTATIYRTINTFVENNIIHQIPLESKTAYYALNSVLEEDENSRKEHIHFLCRICRRTYCLENVIIKDLKINKNFRLESLKIIAEGVCDNCGAIS